MYQDQLVIRGAQQHNLKNIDVTLPRHKLVVITGVSGSGKSSLAFDTLYAEGQRRYVESLSSYARQFLGQMEKPKVDFIGGLSPAIAIEQKAVSKNPRSTVGTVTEIYDYLRVLFARVGTPHCPELRARGPGPVGAADRRSASANCPPAPASRCWPPWSGAARAPTRRCCSRPAPTASPAPASTACRWNSPSRISLAKTKKHDIEIVVDRLVVPEAGPEPQDATDLRGHGLLRAPDRFGGDRAAAGRWLALCGCRGRGDLTFSEQNACPACGISFPELTPQMFSFNSPLGMCPECNGLGTKVEFDPDLFVDPDQTLHEGGRHAPGASWARSGGAGPTRRPARSWSSFGHDLDTPWRDLSQECQQAILYGGVTSQLSNRRATGASGRASGRTRV